MKLKNVNLLPALCRCRNRIVTSNKLDFDLRPDLRVQILTIVVNDTLFTDEIILTVQLMDINDNSPVFQNQTYQYDLNCRLRHFYGCLDRSLQV